MKHDRAALGLIAHHDTISKCRMRKPEWLGSEWPGLALLGPALLGPASRHKHSKRVRRWRTAQESLP